MSEKTPLSKNNDCYFYYYSSCSKGDACPFRHEPSALRNETMCIYWSKGHCNKANCIYRHMEITKKRDRIACYFESQPGGCKKPHCPFQHQNILDHPREEDIRKMPDLILPVKKDAEGKPEAKEIERQVIPPSSAGSETPPCLVQPTTKPNPIIVALQDGESDSESVSGSPQKKCDSDTRLSAQLEWELRRLRQIQADEANLIGYTFEDDESQENQGDFVQMKEEDVNEEDETEEVVVEEVVEEVEDQYDAAHRRLHPPAGSSIQSRLGGRPGETSVGVEDLRHSILKHRGKPRVEEYKKPRIEDGQKHRIEEGPKSWAEEAQKPWGEEAPKPRAKLPVVERLGGVAGRTLKETLGVKVQSKQSVKRLTRRKDILEEKGVKTIAQRLGGQPGALATRLGRRVSSEAGSQSSKEERSSSNERSLASRIGLKWGQALEDKEKSTNDSLKNDKKEISQKAEPLGLDFTIKSLADIKAEKQMKSSIQRVQKTNGTKNGTNIQMSETQERKPCKTEDEVRIMTLAEIRASKESESNTEVRIDRQQKRTISPISFSEKSPKKQKVNVRSKPSDQTSSIVSSTPNQEKAEKKFILGSRKLAINRSPIKTEPANTLPLNRTSIKTEPANTLPLNKSSIKTEPANTLPSNRSSIKTKPANTIPLNRTSIKTEPVNISPKQVKKEAPDIVTKEKSTVNVKSSSQVQSKPAETKSEKKLSVSRMDSLLDEEEALLLGGEMLELDDEDINEDELLL